MTAPALVLLANGSADHGVNATMHTLRKRLQTLRPDLSVNVAFHDHCPPTGPQVVSSLAHRGVTEIVFVPMSLTSAVTCNGTASLLSRVRAAHPRLHFAASRPLGPSVELLNLLDERLRESLQAVHATQLDALVLATSGPADARGISLLHRRARQWAAHHRLPCHVAVNDTAGDATAQAVAGLRSQGRRHIAVGSLWLAADEDYAAHAQSALDRGAIAVSRPLGLDDRLLQLAVGRYAYAAMSLLDDETSSAEQLAL